MKKRALATAKGLNYWFRNKYSLPPTDDRFLEMTSVEIEMEYMAHLYRTVLDKGREPDLDEFETAELDAEIDRWANEDNEILDAFESLNNPDDWEEVAIHG